MAVAQTHWRFGTTEGTESTHGWHAAEDANPAKGVIACDTTFLLRITEQADASGNANYAATFQYRKNGGSWTNITTSSTNVRAVTPPTWANGAACTKRLSGTGTFESSGAGCTTDGTSGGTQNDIAANGNSETEIAVQLRSVDLADGDTIEFQIITASHTTYPTLTVDLPVTIGGGTVSGAVTLGGGLVVEVAVEGGTVAGAVTLSGTVSAESEVTVGGGTVAGAASLAGTVALQTEVPNVDSLDEQHFDSGDTVYVTGDAPPVSIIGGGAVAGAATLAGTVSAQSNDVTVAGGTVAGATALAGTPATSCTIGGGTVAGIIALAASVLVTINVAGTVAGQAAYAGPVVAGTIVSGGVVAGTATFTGPLARTVNLAGQVTGAATLGGAVAVTRTIAGGTVVGATTLAGTPGAGTLVAGGVVAGAATLGGGLTAAATVAGGAVAGSSTLGGQVSRVYIVAGGTIAGATGLAGTASRVLTLAGGTVAGAAAFAGNATVAQGQTDPPTVQSLNAEHFTYGQTVYVTGTTGLFTVPGGTVAGATTLAGGLSTAATVSGIVLGAATLAGTPQQTVGLPGTLQGHTTLAGLVTTAVALPGQVVGGTTLAGPTVKIVNVTGALAGAATVAGPLALTRTLPGAVAGATTLAGAIAPAAQTDPPYVDSLAGQHFTVGSIVYVTGNTATNVVLTGAIVSHSTLAGLVTTDRVLPGTIAGATQIAATPEITRQLPGAIHGASSIGAQVTVPIIVTLAFTSPPEGGTVDYPFAVTGTATPGATVELRDDGGVLLATPTVSTGTFSQLLPGPAFGGAVAGAAALASAPLSAFLPLAAGPLQGRSGLSGTISATSGSGAGLWAPLKIGAGGFLSGMDIDPTGTVYLVRTDTYGAYISNGNGPWSQLVTATSMPAASVASMFATDVPWLAEGVYEIRVCPSNSDRFYMALARTIWRSDNRGASWYEAGSGYVPGAIDPNDGFRCYGQKMAVDPANPDVAYVGGADALYVTTNGGASWSAVPGIPASTSYNPDANTYAGMTGVVFDPAGGVTGGRTNRIYACSNGNGFYRSTDGGTTWGPIAGGPTTCAFASVASDGVFYAVDFATNVLWRYQGGTWAALSPGDWVMTVTVDPFNPARVVAGRGSGHLSVSTDRGATWTGWRWAMTSTSADIPWLQTCNGIGSKATAAHLFDPVTLNRIWLADGIGVWRADPTTATTAWSSMSAGIEQLVGRDVLVPPGSNYVFTAGMDRAIFRTLRDNSAFPSVDITMGSTATLIGAWALDYSKLNPQHIAAIVNGQWGGALSGYSLDNGATWVTFPTQPAGGTAGCIMVPHIDNIIAIIGIDGRAYRSTNRGVSWAVLPGVPGGLHGGYSVKKHVLAVDGGYNGTSNRTMYLYAAGSGTWRSTDDGATWALVSSFTTTGDYWHVRLRSVPGQPGHLFLATGDQGYRQPSPHEGTALYRSTDAGATWAAIPGTGEPHDVAVGAAAPGHTYPAVYFAGWFNSVWGIWRSIDNCATWQQVGQFPYGSVDEVNRLEAARDAYGELYIAYQGSGWGKRNGD